MIPIIDDDIAEPCESFICTLQGGAQDAVRASEPNQVTIRISDDDCEHMHMFSSNVHIVHTMGAYESHCGYKCTFLSMFHRYNA